MAQSGAVLQQTLLNREIIRQLLSAETTCISPAGRLLLRCALVTLRVRPDVSATPATRSTYETRLKIGQPNVIRPGIGVGGDVVAASVI
jgi:hypothetical protein